MVPLCLLCALAGVWATRDSVNIFVQIGLVVLVGLACKNAILIVEFAELRMKMGLNATDAALAAAKLPIKTRFVARIAE